jgi:hypothetical protein
MPWSYLPSGPNPLVSTPTPLQICNTWTFSQFSWRPSLCFPLPPFPFDLPEGGVHLLGLLCECGYRGTRVWAVYTFCVCYLQAGAIGDTMQSPNKHPGPSRFRYLFGACPSYLGNSAMTAINNEKRLGGGGILLVFSKLAPPAEGSWVLFKDFMVPVSIVVLVLLIVDSHAHRIQMPCYAQT